MRNHFAVLGDDPDNSIFVKLVTESVEKEYDKARAMYKLSLDTDLFTAAEPLSFCTDSNLLVYRALPPFHTIGHALGSYNQRFKNRVEKLSGLFYKAGEILAELHESIHLTAQHKSVTPEIYANTSLSNNLLRDLTNKGPIAHLHWDYGFSNLLVIDLYSESPKLCVIDAVPQIIRGASITDKGSIYIDIGMFLSQIYLCAFPAYYYPTYKWENDYTLSMVFLGGYEHRAGIELSSYAAFSSAFLISELYSSLSYINNSIKSIIKRNILQRGLRRLSSVSQQTEL